MRHLDEERSILDDVRDQANSLSKNFGTVLPPQDIPNAADLTGLTRLLFDLTHLALKTDSTRLITIMLAGSTAAPPI